MLADRIKYIINSDNVNKQYIYNFDEDINLDKYKSLATYDASGEYLKAELLKDTIQAHSTPNCILFGYSVEAAISLVLDDKEFFEPFTCGDRLTFHLRFLEPQGTFKVIFNLHEVSSNYKEWIQISFSPSNVSTPSISIYKGGNKIATTTDMSNWYTFNDYSQVTIEYRSSGEVVILGDNSEAILSSFIGAGVTGGFGFVESSDKNATNKDILLDTILLEKVVC